jgi:hypothetical protein
MRRAGRDDSVLHKGDKFSRGHPPPGKLPAGEMRFPRRLIDYSLWNLSPRIFIIHDNDDRQQRKDQHVIFPLRQNESVCGKGDEATDQCAGYCARFRHVVKRISQTVPDGKQEQPEEKYKSRDSGLDEKREDVAID